ncbi:MAG: hypothetical protein ABR575_12010 [Actinomycetota bacterium]
MTRASAAALAALALLAASPATAGHRPNAYCSPSGDVCQSTAKVDGVRKLRITLAAEYFTRYRLCVTGPNDARTCKTFRIEQRGPVFGDSVRWSTNFPNEGRGAYDVVWKMLSGERIGRRLGFHR